jgi:hypothetical protein
VSDRLEISTPDLISFRLPCGHQFEGHVLLEAFEGGIRFALHRWFEGEIPPQYMAREDGRFTRQAFQAIHQLQGFREILPGFLCPQDQCGFLINTEPVLVTSLEEILILAEASSSSSNEVDVEFDWSPYFQCLTPFHELS